MSEWFPLLMFAGTFAILLAGYPVAFSLAGSALIFAALGALTGDFEFVYLAALPERVFGVMTNDTLVAVPLFVFMGVVLERSRLAEELLDTMAKLFGNLRGGLGISVCLVGGLLAASTGIVGATVVTMGMISLPSMMRRNYSPQLATGIIAASGTLGQIIPPSIVLIILGDVISSANQQAQLALGNFAPTTVSVGDLFIGALVPGLVLMLLYVLYVAGVAWLRPAAAPAVPRSERTGSERVGAAQVLKALAPPLILITGVLGSILAGIATPTEAAAVGSVGALVLAAVRGALTLGNLREVTRATTEVSVMVFTILLGASVFSLVFRGFGGDELVQDFLQGMGDGPAASFVIVMGVMFLLGFFLDFFEITFVVVPIVGPILIMMGLDPLWLGVMIAMNLQTSFLTPPFGFSLFYLRGVAPPAISTLQIYRGAVPFIIIQILMLVALWFWPALVTWLPGLAP